MARIAGVDVPGKKRVEVSLQYIYGVGITRALDLLSKVGIDRNTRTEQLSDQQMAKIKDAIDSEFKVEGDLRKEVSMNIKRLIDLGSYRGLRHKAKLPVRGQRTHTNARTRKGRPRIAVAGKKRAPGPN